MRDFSYGSPVTPAQLALKADRTEVDNKSILQGDNLLYNGTGHLQDNTNFSDWDYDSEDADYAAGAFTRTGQYVARFSDELIPIDPFSAYKLSLRAKFTANSDPLGQNRRHYFGLALFDADGAQISAYMAMGWQGTLATLLSDFTPGVDTVMELDNVDGFQLSPTSAVREGIIIWNYVGGSGRAYKPYEYSRYTAGFGSNSAPLFNASVATPIAGGFSISVDAAGVNSNHPGGTIPAGTQISQTSAGGTFKYIAGSGITLPADWTTQVGYIGGRDTTGTNRGNNFSPAVAYVKFLSLPNYAAPAGNDGICHISNVQLVRQPQVTLAEVPVALGAGQYTGAVGTTGFDVVADAGGVTSIGRF